MIWARRIGLALIPIIAILLLVGILLMVTNDNVLTKYSLHLREIFSDVWRIDNLEWWEKRIFWHENEILIEISKIITWKQGFIIAAIAAPSLSIVSLSLIIVPFFASKK